jgi:formylmethanofuran dehydrogenase subunit B
VHVVPNVTCLGCGCACDDIAVVVEDDRIVEARHACPLGAAWFGDGTLPARACADGGDVALDAALDRAARVLTAATRPLVYLAPDLSCEAQREGVAIADALRGALDSLTSATVMGAVLAQQERGRAGATLGEVRNRADVVVFWGVDPAASYPRYPTRYAPDPPGVHVPEGRRSRVVVAVDVGESRGPADADLRVAIAPDEEVAAITRLRAEVTARDSDRARETRMPELVSALLSGKYVVIVADAEPDLRTPSRDPGRADALIALTQALNGPTRCALSVLRGGGNRSGADAVATWQTGYPAAIGFTRGYPQYRPHAAAARLRSGDFDAVLVLGSLSSVPEEVRRDLMRFPGAILGPRASVGAVADRHVAIDTGMAGIHEGGTALRMDDVPLPLRPSAPGPPPARDTAAALLARIRFHLKSF